MRNAVTHLTGAYDTDLAKFSHDQLLPCIFGILFFRDAITDVLRCNTCLLCQ